MTLAGTAAPTCEMVAAELKLAGTELTPAGAEAAAEYSRRQLSDSAGQEPAKPRCCCWSVCGHPQRQVFVGGEQESAKPKRCCTSLKVSCGVNILLLVPLVYAVYSLFQDRNALIRQAQEQLVSSHCCGEEPFLFSCAPLKLPETTCRGDTGIVAVNESYTTSCAEVDNVKIAFKRISDTRPPHGFRIRAQPPRYTNSTMLNNREEVWEDCKGDSFRQPTERKTYCDSSWQKISKGLWDGGRFVFRDIVITSGIHVTLSCQPDWKFGASDFNFDGRSYPFTMLEVMFEQPGKGWSTNFVLYSNGYVRLNAMPPVGLTTWVPFGSSVVVGPSADSHFPWSPLSSATLVANTPLTLELSYDSNAQTTPVKLVIGASAVAGTLDVTGLSWSDRKQAYLRYSAMYVRKSKSDAETITVANQTTFPLIGSASFPGVPSSQWTTLPGPSWGLTKQCVSIHNTRSPDIFITADCSGH